MISVYYSSDPREAVEALLDAPAGANAENSRKGSSRPGAGADSLAGLGRHSRVVIKPNLVVAKRQWIGADTRPEVVEAIVRRLQERGVTDITVADGSGVGHSASRAFPMLGYDELARKYGFKLLDIEKDRFVTRSTLTGGPFRKLQISRTAAECDFLINVPVLKAHGETKLTCSLKNLKGLMPKEMKPRFHSVDLHRAIAQLNTVVAADLIVVDGAYGDINSEMGGSPVEMGIMAAGTDPLEIDTFVAKTLGFSPDQITHLRHYAGYRGVDLASFRPEVAELNSPTLQTQFSADTDPFSRYPCGVSAEGSCCTCRGNLVFALKRLNERGELSRDQYIINGKRGELPEQLLSGTGDGDRREGAKGRGGAGAGRGGTADGAGGEIIAVGDCALQRMGKVLKRFESDSQRSVWRVPRVITIEGCPPETVSIVDDIRGQG
jgi:uncharacterized protein (DUF362 family)